ncbi:MAG TPA: CHAT domain-containing protein, partial [Microlunatus sp.]|nr:CHAT domain-containing protein [Microlunatus sp.]
AAVHNWQRRVAADLDLLANANLPSALRTAASQSLQRGTDELGRLLAAALPADHRPVVISPPSELLSLPWPLLPQLRGRPVCVTPSLSGWYRARADLAASRAARPWSVTAAAGPDLARSQQEAADVVSTWSSRVPSRDRPAATSAELLAGMAQSRLVHVAAHGAHQSANPMFSSLALADGPLFAYELDRQGRVPEHVVLSACDVGRSSARPGEETLGMTSVLLQLGSACVVAGVSRVHDDVAAEVMQRYHRELVAGRGTPEALCLAAERLGVPHPFVCFGAAWAAVPSRR